MAENIEYRIEHDTMGEVRVPANALYRAQTQRAVDNFPISGQTLESAHIRALALVKKAAATANEELQVLDAERAQAIREAADLVATGEYDEHFPIDVFQTGSGTSSNMNTNEVLATLATRSLESRGIEVHPNDHVNASQSSNDVFPTSVHVAVTEALVKELVPSLEVCIVRKEVRRVQGRRQVRTHPPDGCNPYYLRPRILWLRRYRALRHRASERIPAPRG